MRRLLYLHPGLVPPSRDPSRDKFTYLSEVTEGDLLLPVWWSSVQEAPRFLQEVFPVYRVSNFRYHFFLAYRFHSSIRRLATFLYYVRRGLHLHREKKFEVIMVYGTNATGVAGVVLKWLTGAKLIVEIPGVPENAFRYDSPNTGRGTAIKRFFANGLLYLVSANADCMKLLYPWQLKRYPWLRKKRSAVFHDFVPVRTIANECCEEKFVLLAGFPWYTKGVDVLIRAFKSIAPLHPEYTLKLMGYFPEQTYLDQLAFGCPRIEFIPARPNERALKVIAGCAVYVLASRTESMGRVLLEAMAAGKPIIASRVGGVPYYIADGETGLLFESENVEQLAEKLSTMLKDTELRNRLSRKAHEKVMSEFDERSYVEAFQRMLEGMFTQ